MSIHLTINRPTNASCQLLDKANNGRQVENKLEEDALENSSSKVKLEKVEREEASRREPEVASQDQDQSSTQSPAQNNSSELIRAALQKARLLSAEANGVNNASPIENSEFVETATIYPEGQMRFSGKAAQMLYYAIAQSALITNGNAAGFGSAQIVGVDEMV